jgi:hypothetical protein
MFSQWFHTVSDARKFVGWTCSSQVKSVDDIIAHIRVREAPHQAPHPDNKEIMDLFQKHVVAYLRGVGHPDDQYVRDVVGANVFDAGKGDPLLRVNALLKTARASDILPTSPVWYIDVKLFFLCDMESY